MRTTIVLLALLAIACSKNATGPKGSDPIVLARNQTASDTFHVVWFDQSGQISDSRILPSTEQCVHFTSTQLADSVRFTAWITSDGTADTSGNGHAWGTVSSSWFYPASSPFWAGGGEWWTLTASRDPGGASFTIVDQPVTAAPC
jgi:hypothetical protein